MSLTKYFQYHPKAVASHSYHEDARMTDVTQRDFLNAVGATAGALAMTSVMPIPTPAGTCSGKAVQTAGRSGWPMCKMARSLLRAPPAPPPHEFPWHHG